MVVVIISKQWWLRRGDAGEGRQGDDDATMTSTHRHSGSPVSSMPSISAYTQPTDQTSMAVVYSPSLYSGSSGARYLHTSGGRDELVVMSS